MLFDLRSRGRRRFIRVVYLFLALLIGGGLVLFGVGGGSNSTGVLSQLAQNGGGGSADGLKIAEKAVARTGRLARAAPNSAAAWDHYALALYELARSGDNYVTTTSTSTTGFTKSGAKVLATTNTAWQHYLSLSPRKPDEGLAADIAAAFGSSGIGEYAIAETAQEIVAEQNPTSYEQYAFLAEDAYLAHESDRAAIAQATALRLAPKSVRTELKADLAEIAAEATASSSTGSSGTTGTTGTSG
jgi:hypothetical protein